MFNLKNLYGIEAKGNFPYRFNRPKNYNYIGPMPDIEYYEIDRMNDDKRNDFIDWYNEQVENNYIFNFQKELKKYCEMDVDILLWSVVEFRNKILSMEGFDTFINSTTAASLSMNNYLGNYFEEDTIMVNKRYTENKNNYSVKSLKW